MHSYILKEGVWQEYLKSQYTYSNANIIRIATIQKYATNNGWNDPVYSDYEYDIHGNIIRIQASGMSNGLILHWECAYEEGSGNINQVILL